GGTNFLYHPPGDLQVPRPVSVANESVDIPRHRDGGQSVEPEIHPAADSGCCAGGGLLATAALGRREVCNPVVCGEPAPGFESERFWPRFHGARAVLLYSIYRPFAARGDGAGANTARK